MQRSSSLRSPLPLLVAGLLAVAACSGSPAPTTTTAATTTTTPPSTTTTSAPTPAAEGFDWVPASVGECRADIDAIEKVMADHPRTEVESGEHFTAFGELLRVIMHNCRSDYIKRWNLEVYMPWLAGSAVTPGRVPHDFSRWPPEWLPHNSTTTTLPADAPPAESTTTTLPEED